MFKFLRKALEKKARKDSTEEQFLFCIKEFYRTKNSRWKLWNAVAARNVLKHMKEDDPDMWKFLTDSYPEELEEMTYYIYSTKSMYL